jgi:hypothetical protein
MGEIKIKKYYASREIKYFNDFNYRVRNDEKYKS